MSYGIGNIIYGINLTNFNFGELELDENDIDCIITGEINGFDTNYNGSGDEPIWFGVQLWDIEEGQNILWSSIADKVVVTDEVKEKWENLLANMEPEIKEAFDKWKKTIQIQIFLLNHRFGFCGEALEF